MTPLLLALLAAPDVNLLSLEAGAVLVEASSWDGLRTPAAFVEGDPNGSRSSSDAKSPHAFVYELEQRSAVIAVDVRDTRPESNAPSGLEVWVSSAGPAEGFARVATLSLKRSGSLHAAVPKETFGRWVRVVVTGNQDTLASELMEVVVSGHPLEPSPVKPFTGAWRIESGGVLRLSTDGATVSGCAAWPDKVWTVKGVVQGRAAAVTWVDEVDPAAGTAVVAMGDDGALRGRWRDEVSSNLGAWLGVKRPDAAVDCRAAIESLRFNRRLSRVSPLNLTLTGVGFDATTDELRLEARNELLPLERLLAKGTEGQRARILVLGPTTEPLADELKRCERRAQRLAAHLRQAGVPEGAVELGVGVLKLDAIQLEPRVEVLLLSN